MDESAAPLSDEERAELEQLRAEKAQREREERIRAERAELERLRAQSREASQAQASPAAPAGPASQQGGRPQMSAAEAEQARRDAEARERARKLMEPDDDLRMPLAQKITLCVVAIIVIAVICSIFFGVH